MTEQTKQSTAPTQKVLNRWGVVIGAILIQLCLGAIYAWSVFTPALTAKDPADVVAVYSASKLGLDEAKLKQMKDALAEPKAELKLVVAEIKKLDEGDSVADQAKAEILKVKQKALRVAMDTVAVQYGVKDKVDALAYGFSKAQTQMVFAAGLAFFAIIMVIAGRMMPSVGPRKLTIAGGLVLGLGYILAGVVTPGNFLTTLIFVGIIGGSGIGLGYVVPIAVGMKWFPDKKGMITGLAVAGFGFGALLWIYLAGQFGQLIAGLGLGTTFIVYGVAFFLLCAIGAIWMKNPPEGWTPAGYKPPEAKGGAAPAAGSQDFTSGEMLAKAQYYMIFLAFAFGASAGLMSIGLMKLFPKEALEAAGKTPAEASALAGTAMAVFFSLANGIGRIAWGAMSDKLGRKLSIFLMLATQGIFVILFQWMAGSPATLFLFATLIGFNFGGNFALFPTITADTFGTKNIGQNYGWVFLAYGFGGIFGPILGGKLGDMGDFPMAFTICGVLCLVAAAIIVGVKAPKHKEAAAA